MEPTTNPPRPSRRASWDVVKARGVSEWHLVGTRAGETEWDVCVMCKSPLQPAIALIAKRGPTRLGLCLPCVARAVEAATGWRVSNAWSQWLNASIASQEQRNAAASLSPTTKYQSSTRRHIRGSK